MDDGWDEEGLPTADKTGEFPALATPPPPGTVARRGKLLLLVGDDAGRGFPVGDGVTIGRGAQCEVRIDDPVVSRRHARVYHGPDGPIAEDLGSRNGTFVNGERLDAPGRLRFGDRVELGGRVALLFTHDDPMESILRERQQMEAIGRIAAGVSHDFNNLVGAALATVHHLRARTQATSPPDPDVAECCEDLELVLARAADLTRALSTLGRRGDGSRKGPIDVSDVCQEVARLCRRTFGVRYEIETRAGPGLVVHGNRTELHQVLLNLCLNARDAMPEGGQLTIRASRVARDGADEAVRVRVEDTGEGMDRPTVERIFEPFFTTKGAGRGSGLGLSTVAELVRGMGARIDVESEPGVGTAFSIDIPALDGASAPPSRRPTSSGTIPAGERELPAGRIIVADDQALLRRSVGRVLSSAGHTVMYARDGAEALRLYANCDPRPEVVLVDLDMPGVGGEQVLRALADDPSRPAVVIMSGHWDPQRAEELVRAGAAKYLGKPFDPRALRDAVGSLVAEVTARRRAS